MQFRIIRALSLIAVGGAAGFGQPLAAEKFVADELRPYYAHTGFAWKIDRVSNFELNYEAGTEAELRLTQLTPGSMTFSADAASLPGR